MLQATVVLKLLCPATNQQPPIHSLAAAGIRLLPHRIPAGRSKGQSQQVPAEPAPAPQTPQLQQRRGGVMACGLQLAPNYCEHN